MELLIVLAALVALALLSQVAGHDSRDGLAPLDPARWQPEHESRLLCLHAADPTRADVESHRAALLAGAARERALRRAPRARALPRPDRAAAAWLGAQLVAAGRALERLAAPSPGRASARRAS